MPERTLVLLKPDTVQRGLAGRVIGRLEDRGLKIVGIKMVHMDIALANRLYAEHVNKPFFAGLSEFMMSRPIIAIALEGKNATEVVRATMGATDPQKAAPGTVRGDFGTDIGRNLIHGSDSPEAAERELGILFGQGETFDYERETDRWINES